MPEKCSGWDKVVWATMGIIYHRSHIPSWLQWPSFRSNWLESLIIRFEIKLLTAEWSQFLQVLPSSTRRPLHLFDLFYQVAQIKYRLHQIKKSLSLVSGCLFKYLRCCWLQLLDMRATCSPNGRRWRQNQKYIRENTFGKWFMYK